MCTCASLYQFYSSKMRSNSGEMCLSIHYKTTPSSSSRQLASGNMAKRNERHVNGNISLPGDSALRKERKKLLLFSSNFSRFHRNRLQLSWSFVGKTFFCRNFFPHRHISPLTDERKRTNVNMANFCSIFCSFFWWPVFVAIVKLPRMLRDSWKFDSDYSRLNLFLIAIFQCLPR